MTLKDPSGRIQWGGCYHVESVGLTYVQVRQDVRFSPSGPIYRQVHRAPLTHIASTHHENEVLRLAV